MDTARFAAELPRLFEDFPHSPHPLGRRFDDVIATVPNLAMENNLALVNLAVSLLGPGESYVEAGAYMGASLIAAARENEGADLVAIDNFRFGPGGVKGRTFPKASRAGLDANLERFGVTATILEGDAIEVLSGGTLADRSVGAFYYDASHDYDAQIGALRLVEPFLAPSALLVVDDSDWDDVRRATRDYLASQPRAKLLFDLAGGEEADAPWWYGMQVLAWG